MPETLEQLADAAEETSREQSEVARRARRLDRLRRRGVAWSTILDGEPSPSLLELLARSTHRMRRGTSTLRKSIVDALAEEGLSTRQIARRLGVSHQRVSAMRNHRR